jgi:uncharacterized YceG family protein
MSPFGKREEPPSSRTEAERERARQEREARRAARNGRGASAPPSPSAPSSAVEPAAPIEPPVSAQPPAPADPPAPDEPQPQGAQPPAPAEPPPPAPAEPPPSAPTQPRAPQPIFDPEPPRAVTNVRPVGAPDAEHPGEAPLGMRRVRAGSPLATAAGAEAPPRQHQHGIPSRRGVGRLFAVAALLAVLVIAWFMYSLIQPLHGDGGKPIRVVIPNGLGASQIADLLETRGVVGSSFFFNLRTRIAGERESLHSGTFELREDMSYGAAIKALTTAPPPPKTIKVTIPEGRSAREAAPLVRQAGLEGDYLAATRRSARNLGAPRGIDTLEGFLFPATYELKPGASVRRLVRDQLTAFRRNVDGVSLRRARAKNLTRYDVLIIASMVEREAGVAKDRRLISAVIYNRLKERMPLGIDATIRYRLNNWSRPLRVSELQADSAYNTRTRLGLPPTPIGNPGLESLKAAANPANVDYLYYVVKPCGNGAHAFSSTDAEFQRDVTAYNRARDQRGGNDPSRC